MSPESIPPPILENARILEYAVIDESVKFTGQLILNVDGEWLGAVPGIALAESFNNSELIAFHCDENWNVLGVQTWNSPDGPVLKSIADLKEKMEKYYCGISELWVQHTATAREALDLYEESQRAHSCSFCGKTRDEIERLVSGPNANICSECLRDFHNQIRDL